MVVGMERERNRLEEGEGANRWGPPGSKRERGWRWEAGLGRCWADWALRERKGRGGGKEVDWARRREKVLFVFFNSNTI